MSRQEQAYHSAVCLAGLVREDGSFLYRYDSRSGEPKGGYNILRHAGAIWALLDTFRDTRDERLLSGAQRATHHLLASSLRFFRSYSNVCICEDNTIKLGGNALAALALLSLFEVTRERLLLTLAEQLCQFMLDQRRQHGDLVHKRYFESGKISAFRSMYYTGEALLAILTLYQQTGDSHWLDAAIEIEEPLAAEGYGVQEQSHWMLYALELLAQFFPLPDLFAPRRGNRNRYPRQPGLPDLGEEHPDRLPHRRTPGLPPPALIRAWRRLRIAGPLPGAG